MGFDTEMFVDNVDENFLCSICHGVLEKPTAVCIEGHTFCHDCIDVWTSSSDICPDCRSMSGNKILCRPVQSLIMKLKVKCPAHVDIDSDEDDKKEEDNDAQEEDETGIQTRARKKARVQEDEDGDDKETAQAEKPPATSKSCCDWEGTLFDYIDKHKDGTCKFRSVKCPQGCGKMIHVSSLQAHAASRCSHRQVSCSHCSDEMKQHELQHHLEHDCMEQTTACEYCGEQMLRKLLGSKPSRLDVDDTHKYSGHYQTCTKIFVKCDYHEQGCTSLLQRENLDQHYTDCGRKHAKLLAKALHKIKADKEWHSSKEMYWEIPVYTIRAARYEERFIRESIRTRVGPFSTFLRLVVVNRKVYVYVCVDEWSHSSSPVIAGVKIKVVRGNSSFGRLSLNGERSMIRDGGVARSSSTSSTFSVGGVLRYQQQDTTLTELLQWSNLEKVTIFAQFRLRAAFGVVMSTTSLTAREPEFWASLQL